jgi:hypothetical protein
VRAHLYKPITNITGDVQSGTVVRVLQPDAIPEAAVSIIDPVFVGKTGIDEAGTTFTVTNGVVDVWLDAPQYVMLGLTPPGALEYFIDNVAVLSPDVAAPSGSGSSPLWVARIERGPLSTSFQDWTRDGSDPRSIFGDAGVLDEKITNNGDSGDGFRVVESGLYSVTLLVWEQWTSDPGFRWMVCGRIAGMDFYSPQIGANFMVVQPGFITAGTVTSPPTWLEAFDSFPLGTEGSTNALIDGKHVAYITKWA